MKCRYFKWLIVKQSIHFQHIARVFLSKEFRKEMMTLRFILELTRAQKNWKEQRQSVTKVLILKFTGITVTRKYINTCINTSLYVFVFVIVISHSLEQSEVKLKAGTLSPTEDPILFIKHLPATFLSFLHSKCWFFFASHLPCPQL